MGLWGREGPVLYCGSYRHEQQVSPSCSHTYTMVMLAFMTLYYIQEALSSFCIHIEEVLLSIIKYLSFFLVCRFPELFKHISISLLNLDIHLLAFFL